MTRTEERLLTAPFLLSSAANFLQSLSFNLYLHLPGYLKDLGADELQIGLVFSVTAATAIAARPLFLTLSRWCVLRTLDELLG